MLDPVIASVTVDADGTNHYKPDYRGVLEIGLAEGTVVVARKRSRIIAVQQKRPFTVETDHGTMRGEAGDYLVTNHPDDDDSSDIWPLSRERFEASYEPA